MSMRTRSLPLMLFVVLSANLLHSQGGANGTILGTVTDSSGAALANAGVDVSNAATGVTNHTQTTSAGDFTVPYLQPGTYRVTAQASGFQKSITDNVGLVVGQQARVNITMKPGATTEVVEVHASAVALDTDSSAVAQTVTQKEVDELPLNGRNFISLLFITAGAVQTEGEQGVMRQGQGNAISINGGRPESNNYTLDGLTNTDTALNTPAVILSQDAIQEFKVQSETYSAEYGYSANQINIVSKSGTNQLHGTGFEFLRNDALDAIKPTPFQVTAKKPVLRQNQFGFVLGGPVYIPKLYDGRNKTFWLANYEGWRIQNGFVENGSVPTAAELNGDFSASGLPAFDLTPGSPCQQALTSSPSTPCMPGDPQTGAAFAGSMIPTTSFSHLAQAAIAAGAFPTPTPACVANPNVCGGGINNYQLAATLPNTTNQQTYKLDQELGRAGRVFFRYTKAHYANESPSNYSGVPILSPFNPNVFVEDQTSWTIAHNISLGTHNVNNFRVGYLHATAIQGAPPTSDNVIQALGLSNLSPLASIPSYARGFPNLNFDSNVLSAFGGPPLSPTTTDIPTWEFADSMTMIRGKHTIAVGFDYRRWVQKRNVVTDLLGTYNYASSLVLSNSNGCSAPSGFCGTGNGFADFLLGYYSGATAPAPGPFSDPKVAGNLAQLHYVYFAPYVQDDWKLNNRLTLNIGLRWDYRSVPYEQDNKMFWLDDQNMPGGSRYSGGGLCFADPALATDGIAPSGNGVYNYCGRRNPADGSKTPFAPRFGFAYRPFGEKTVVRGGYGIYWDSSLTRENDGSGNLYPYVTNYNFSPNFQATAPKLTDQLFPALPPLSPVTPPVIATVIISDRPRNPYVQQYTLSVQRELARNTTLEVNYVGNRGLHLLDRVNFQTPSQLTGTQLANCQAAFAGLPATNAAFISNQCPFYTRLPLPNMGIVGINSSWSGYSNYNAGNVKLEHRGNSIALLTVYTYSKSMDDKSAPAGIGASGNSFVGHMNDFNPRLDYGPSDFSVKHRFVNSVVYQLPVGRGKRFLGAMNRTADALVGGWQLSAITTFQTGFPFSVIEGSQPGGFNSAYFFSFGFRPNQIGDPSLSHKSINEWFNTAAFSSAPYGVYGNEKRNSLTQPGINNWDIGLSKTFKFTEKAGLQLRLETFNTFNHTQYGVDPFDPNASFGAVGEDITSPTFGKVLSARPGRIVQLGGKISF
jgi:hypothetical protein